MDRKLVAWARAVKARRDRGRGRRARALPVLFFFTDDRVADPAPLIARLPRGLCGVVLRARDDRTRAALAARLAPICRRAGVPLLAGGDGGLARRRGVGLHLAGGRGPAPRVPRPLTAAVHDAAELHRARRAGARLIFVSPVFPTASHPGDAALGTLRLARFRGGLRTRRLDAGTDMLALGGIDGATARLLPRFIAGAGAIGAFL